MAVVIPRGFTRRNFFPRRRPAPRRNLTRKVAVLSKKVGNKERKILDTQLTSSALTVAGAITQLTNIAQGLTDATRVGNKITIVGITFNYMLESNVSNAVRLMLVQNKQTNGLVTDIGEILEDQTADDILVSQRNKDFLRKFRVIYDKTHTFSVTGNSVAMMRKHVKVNIPIRYDANVGDITDVQTNSLNWFSSCLLADASMVQTVSIRLWFTDS